MTEDNSSNDNHADKRVLRYPARMRGVALLVALSFSAQDLVWAQGSALWAARPAAKPAPLFNVPKSLGTPHGSNFAHSDETVIHIEDAHDSFEAQEKIHGLLTVLANNYDVRSVALEGSSGQVSPALFTTYPDRSFAIETAKNLVKEGRLNAGELFAITADDVSVYGVEEKTLYRENLEAFRRLLANREKIEAELRGLSRTLEVLSERIDNPLLKELKRKGLTAGDKNSPDFTKKWDFWRELAEEKGVSVEAYPDLKILNEVTTLEKEINFDKANAEREELLRFFKTRLRARDKKELVLKSLAFKAGKLSDTDFHLYLAETAKAYGIEPASRLHLSRYTQYLSFFDSLDLTSVFTEIENFEEKIKTASFASEGEQALYFLEKDSAMLKDILSGEASAETFERSRDLNEENFAKVLSSLTEKNHVPLYGGLRVEHLFDALPDAVRFYELARRRDKVLLENTLKKMRERHERVAALVTGGFHTRGISQMLEDKNLSYLVVLPKITDPNKKRPYITLITRKTAEYEKALGSDSSPFKLALGFLASADKVDEMAVRAVVERLVKPLREKKDAASRLASWMADYREDFEKNPGANPLLAPDRIEEMAREILGPRPKQSPAAARLAHSTRPPSADSLRAVPSKADGLDLTYDGLLEELDRAFAFDDGDPLKVIIIDGIQGSGKTSLAEKLCGFYRGKGKSAKMTDADAFVADMMEYFGLRFWWLVFVSVVSPFSSFIKKIGNPLRVLFDDSRAAHFAAEIERARRLFRENPSLDRVLIRFEATRHNLKQDNGGATEEKFLWLYRGSYLIIPGVFSGRLYHRRIQDARRILVQVDEKISKRRHIRRDQNPAERRKPWVTSIIRSDYMRKNIVRGLNARAGVYDLIVNLNDLNRPKLIKNAARDKVFAARLANFEPTERTPVPLASGKPLTAWMDERGNFIVVDESTRRTHSFTYNQLKERLGSSAYAEFEVEEMLFRFQRMSNGNIRVLVKNVVSHGGLRQLFIVERLEDEEKRRGESEAVQIMNEVARAKKELGDPDDFEDPAQLLDTLQALETSLETARSKVAGTNSVTLKFILSTLSDNLQKQAKTLAAIPDSMPEDVAKLYERSMRLIDEAISIPSKKDEASFWRQKSIVLESFGNYYLVRAQRLVRWKGDAQLIRELLNLSLKRFKQAKDALESAYITPHRIETQMGEVRKLLEQLDGLPHAALAAPKPPDASAGSEGSRLAVEAPGKLAENEQAARHQEKIQFFELLEYLNSVWLLWEETRVALPDGTVEIQFADCHDKTAFEFNNNFPNWAAVESWPDDVFLVKQRILKNIIKHRIRMGKLSNLKSEDQDTLFRLAAFLGISDPRKRTPEERLVWLEIRKRKILGKEGRFHRPRIAYDELTGLAFDSFDLAAQKSRNLGVGSKESLHLAILGLALLGNEGAQAYILGLPLSSDENGQNGQTFILPEDAARAESLAFELLAKKIASYKKFRDDEKFKGFGGFLPWFRITERGIEPLPEWKNKVPSLDNGQFIWALYFVYHALEQKSPELSKDYREYFETLKKNAVKIFYEGDGKIRAEAGIENPAIDPSANHYSTTNGFYLDDPYEGEMMAHFLTLFADWNGSGLDGKEEIEKIWRYKRAKLEPVHYPLNGTLITGLKGERFAPHELWGLLFLPYLQILITSKIFKSGETVRTHEAAKNKEPGLRAAAYDPALAYRAAMGVEAMARKKPVDAGNVFAPYAAYPLLLIDPEKGLQWWHAMTDAPQMRSDDYGVKESALFDGTPAEIVTSDAKYLVALSLMGGVYRQIGEYLENDGKRQMFDDRVESEYVGKFPIIHGQDAAIASPTDSIPHHYAAARLALGGVEGLTLNNGKPNVPSPVSTRDRAPLFGALTSTTDEDWYYRYPSIAIAEWRWLRRLIFFYYARAHHFTMSMGASEAVSRKVIERVAFQAPLYLRVRKDVGDYEFTGWPAEWFREWLKEAESEKDPYLRMIYRYIALQFIVPDNPLYHGVEQKLRKEYTQAKNADYVDHGLTPPRIITNPFGTSKIPAELILPAQEPQGKGFPIVIFLHGFSNRRENPYFDDLERRLVGNGIAVLRLDFLRHGDNVFSLKAPHDMDRFMWLVIRHIERDLGKLGVDVDRKGVFGFSFGAYLVLRALANEKMGEVVKAAVAVNAPVDDTFRKVNKIIGRDRSYVHYFANNGHLEIVKGKIRMLSMPFEDLRLLRDRAGKLCVVIGKKDRVVSKKDTAWIEATLRGTEAEIWSYPNEGHYIFFNKDEMVRRATKHFLAMLRPQNGIAARLATQKILQLSPRAKLGIGFLVLAAVGVVNLSLLPFLWTAPAHAAWMLGLVSYALYAGAIDFLGQMIASKEPISWKQVLGMTALGMPLGLFTGGGFYFINLVFPLGLAFAYADGVMMTLRVASQWALTFLRATIETQAVHYLRLKEERQNGKPVSAAERHAKKSEAYWMSRLLSVARMAVVQYAPPHLALWAEAFLHLPFRLWDRWAIMKEGLIAKSKNKFVLTFWPFVIFIRISLIFVRNSVEASKNGIEKNFKLNGKKPDNPSDATVPPTNGARLAWQDERRAKTKLLAQHLDRLREEVVESLREVRKPWQEDIAWFLENLSTATQRIGMSASVDSSESERAFNLLADILDRLVDFSRRLVTADFESNSHLNLLLQDEILDKIYSDYLPRAREAILMWGGLVDSHHAYLFFVRRAQSAVYRAQRDLRSFVWLKEESFVRKAMSVLAGLEQKMEKSLAIALPQFLSENPSVFAGHFDYVLEGVWLDLSRQSRRFNPIQKIYVLSELGILYQARDWIADLDGILKSKAPAARLAKRAAWIAGFLTTVIAIVYGGPYVVKAILQRLILSSLTAVQLPEDEEATPFDRQLAAQRNAARYLVKHMKQFDELKQKGFVQEGEKYLVRKENVQLSVGKTGELTFGWVEGIVVLFPMGDKIYAYRFAEEDNAIMLTTVPNEFSIDWKKYTPNSNNTRVLEGRDLDSARKLLDEVGGIMKNQSLPTAVREQVIADAQKLKELSVESVAVKSEGARLPPVRHHFGGDGQARLALPVILVGFTAESRKDVYEALRGRLGKGIELVEVDDRLSPAARLAALQARAKTLSVAETFFIESGFEGNAQAKLRFLKQLDLTDLRVNHLLEILNNGARLSQLSEKEQEKIYDLVISFLPPARRMAPVEVSGARLGPTEVIKEFQLNLFHPSFGDALANVSLPAPGGKALWTLKAVTKDPLFLRTLKDRDEKLRRNGQLSIEDYLVLRRGEETGLGRELADWFGGRFLYIEEGESLDGIYRKLRGAPNPRHVLFIDSDENSTLSKDPSRPDLSILYIRGRYVLNLDKVVVRLLARGGDIQDIGIERLINENGRLIFAPATPIDYEARLAEFYRAEQAVTQAV